MCKKSKKVDLLEEADKEFFPSAKRDVYYSALVKDIVKNNRTSQVLKCCFFTFVCLIFIFTCVVGMLIILNISQKDDISMADIGVAITGFGSVLSSIIVLPQTIAKHLFPEDSESTRFEFIKDNQQFDSAFLLNNDNSTYGDDEEEVEGTNFGDGEEITPDYDG